MWGWICVFRYVLLNWNSQCSFLLLLLLFGVDRPHENEAIQSKILYKKILQLAKDRNFFSEGYFIFRSGLIGLVVLKNMFSPYFQASHGNSGFIPSTKTCVVDWLGSLNCSQCVKGCVVVLCDELAPHQGYPSPCTPCLLGWTPSFLQPYKNHTTVQESMHYN